MAKRLCAEIVLFFLCGLREPKTQKCKKLQLLTQSFKSLKVLRALNAKLGEVVGDEGNSLRARKIEKFCLSSTRRRLVA